MTDDVCKRPLARPLFLWITGIIAEVCVPLRQWSLLLLLPISLLVVVSFFVRKREVSLSYDMRWVWGVPIACVFVFLSIQMTVLAEERLSEPPRVSRVQEEARQIQLQVVDKLNRLQLSEREKAVLATITVNYRRMMTRDIRARFSAIGMAHLLSVSGFHVALVCGFWGLLFSVFPKRPFFRWLRYVLMMLLLWAFAAVSGLSAPAVRAALMLSVFLTGQVLRRQPEKYNTLAAAALLMLIYNPFYLFDIGFQLSFSAVFFIFYLQPRFYRLLEIRNPLLAFPWGILTLTMAAQIGTFPLCCYYFGELSTVFLFSNLFLSVLAILLIPLTLIWLFLPSSLSGVEFIQTAVEGLTRSLMWFVERFSQVPGATFSMRFDAVALLGVYVILFLTIFYFRSKRGSLFLAALSVLLLLLCRQILLSVNI